MSFLFLTTLLNIMPSRLLLLILQCLFWVNHISWCQICAIWHLLLLANYWRKDNLFMVHVAMSAPCSKGTSSPATQHRIIDSTCHVLKICAGTWGVCDRRMRLKPRGIMELQPVRQEAGSSGSTWPGAQGISVVCMGSAWCRQQTDQGRLLVG